MVETEPSGWLLLDPPHHPGQYKQSIDEEKVRSATWGGKGQTPLPASVPEEGRRPQFG